MVDPCLVPGESVSLISMTFVTIAVQYALQDCQMLALVLSCELFWILSCTNFMKPKSALKDSMSATMTDAKMMHHFIDSHLLIIQNYGMGMFSVLFSVVDVDGHSDHSLSLTLMQLFITWLSICTPHCNKALFPY
jgi:hypothetical protein